MSGIACMVKRTITVFVCIFVAGCSSGPNQPSSALVPVTSIVSVPGTSVDESQWRILEGTPVGQDFTVEGVNFRKIYDYYSARKTRCFRVIRIEQSEPERDYQVICRDQENLSSWYLANQVLASEAGRRDE